MDNIKINQIKLGDILETAEVCGKRDPNIEDYRVYIEIGAEIVPVTAITTKVHGQKQIIFSTPRDRDMEVV